MDPFIRRLVRLLTDEEQPLSRNRHFHTFDNPEGRYALRISRRLKALRRDILACRQEGGAASFTRPTDAEGMCRVELHLSWLNGRRTSLLEVAEFELLTELPGVREALHPAPAPTAGSTPLETSS